MYFLRGVICVACMGITGCIPDEKPDPVFKIETNTEARVQISRIAVFKDNIAYEGRRGIYIIKDNQTGKEFVGISGIGISELGSHANGDETVRDER